LPTTLTAASLPADKVDALRLLAMGDMTFDHWHNINQTQAMALAATNDTEEAGNDPQLHKRQRRDDCGDDAGIRGS
jgi:hypothetical protein